MDPIQQTSSSHDPTVNTLKRKYEDLQQPISLQHFSYHILQDGVVLIKQILTPEQQQVCMFLRVSYHTKQLWKDIQKSTYTHKPTRARNKNSNFTKIIKFNCKKKYDQVPQSFKDYSTFATRIASQICSTIPSTYKIDYITSFVYPQKDGKLTGHCDKVEGWVVLFSLGCTAKFWIHGKQMKEKEGKQKKIKLIN